MTQEKRVPWDETNTEELKNIVGNESPVSVKTVTAAAEMLEFSVARICSKLRKLGYEVDSISKARNSIFSEDETLELAQFVETNSGQFTYADLESQLFQGKFTRKQIQGKIMSLELNEHVLPAEKVVSPKAYTEKQEEMFVAMADSGKNLEEIAEELGKTVNSCRGKALSLLQGGKIRQIPVSGVRPLSTNEDLYDALKDKIPEMTVAEIAHELGKTERGVKTSLTRRGLVAADYDGKAKKEKAEAKCREKNGTED